MLERKSRFLVSIYNKILLKTWNSMLYFNSLFRPFYGRTFTLQDINLRDKGALTKGSGFSGPYTREDGFLGYNEVISRDQFCIPTSRLVAFKVLFKNCCTET